MADIKRISNKNVINNGNVDSNLSMSDILLCQHVAGDNNDYQVSLAQAQAVPYGTCTSAAGEDKVVNLVNYPSSFTAQVGTKILVKFTNANTKGHVSDNTSVDLTAGGVTKPIAAQGKTIGAGAIIAGGIYELTLTPDYWNIDQDTREVTSSYILKSDGSNIYTASQVNGALANKHTLNAITEKTNANECFDSGIGTTFYRLGSNATNKPTTDAVYYIQSNTYNLNGNIRISQIATANDNDIVNTMYTRRAKGTTGNLNWSTWEKVATSSDLNNALTDNFSKNYGNSTISTILNTLITITPISTSTFYSGMFYNTEDGYWYTFSANIMCANATRYIGSVYFNSCNSTRIVRWRINGASWAGQTIST